MNQVPRLIAPHSVPHMIPVIPQSVPRMIAVTPQPITITLGPQSTKVSAPYVTTSVTTSTTSQPVTIILGPHSTKVSAPPPTVSAATSTTSQSVAAASREFAVKVPKTRAQYGVMEFANGLSVDVKDWKAMEMRREINPYTYRPATNLDSNAPSTSTLFTTSLGIVLPKTGAGSEYGREQKEVLKRKRYATKGTNIEDLPWLLTDRSSTEKKLKHYRGLKKGGVTTNSSYYIFIQGKDGFEAYPVEDWYAFTPTSVYKTLDFDEAEKQYQERHKHLSKWFLKHQVKKEKINEDEIENHNDEKGNKSKDKNKRSFKLLDSEDWVNENEEDENENDEREEDDDNDKSNKKSKTNKKNSKKLKDAWTLSDEDENETSHTKVKKGKTTQHQTNENQEDSDDGDHECDEIDYSTDETSDEEDDIKDAHTDKSSMKYEVKGIDEEMKTIPDIEKKLEQMDKNADELDFDDDDDNDDILDSDENDEENGKTTVDDLSDVSKLLKNDAVSKEMESSSDDDDLDDSDDPDKESIDPISNSINTQLIPSEQIKTEKGHKKAREEEMRAIKSKVMSLPSTPSNPSETITEDKVRNLLLRKQYMTFTELIQNFLPKTENLRTKEIKEGIVQKLATILKRLNIEEKIINGKKHVKLKTT
ncbi:unnamed protein product [Rotaria sordida]|uniref:Transcription initiation factor IIF subunit alpha n=1 Tax=Rotaria sordida TaxID=392033 RepID=A0A813Z8X0_9BILA|nr:unnamed protein product [Rotaria sordida]CAF3635258.1 unnamed protein product [Rotaria sordida]